MSKEHIQDYAEVIVKALKKNGYSNESDIKVYTDGFADGVSWALLRLTQVGVDLPDGSDLLITKEMEEVFKP